MGRAVRIELQHRGQVRRHQAVLIREPGWRTVQSKKRYCYQKGFEFRSPNGSSFKRQVVVILGRTGVRIMTAFPTNNSDYCEGTRI